jgi:excinuclease ABC subunit C
MASLDDADDLLPADSDSEALDESVVPDSEEGAVELSIDEAEVDAALDAVAGDDSGAVDAPFRRAAKKVREFPRSPGVYLMKDAAGRVIYVGKAKTLRSRAGSYFLKGAQAERRTADWVQEIADADCVVCDSEVDALLMESRLIKDIQPKYNKELKDDKTFPYLQITTREDFPRVEVTRTPREPGVPQVGPIAKYG